MLTLKSVTASLAACACAVVLLSTSACSTTEEVMAEPAKVNCYIGNNPPILLTPEECSARGGNTTRG
mgnify:FL=1|jgi:hypothetical protein